MNLLNSLTLMSDLAQSPSLMITQLQVGALIIIVKKAQPAMLNTLIDLNFSGRN